MLYSVCDKCDVVRKGAVKCGSCGRNNSPAYEVGGFNAAVATRSVNPSMLVLALVVIATGVLISIILNSGDAGAMELCQQTHSFDVCFSTLNN